MTSLCCDRFWLWGPRAPRYVLSQARGLKQRFNHNSNGKDELDKLNLFTETCHVHRWFTLGHTHPQITFRNSGIETDVCFPTRRVFHSFYWCRLKENNLTPTFFFAMPWDWIMTLWLGFMEMNYYWNPKSTHVFFLDRFRLNSCTCDTVLCTVQLINGSMNDEHTLQDDFVGESVCFFECEHGTW